MNQYRLQAKKGDGTFSEVFKATSIETGQAVAIKCMKKKYDTIEKIKKLPEIQALKLLSPHDHIIRLIEVLYDEPSGKLALVFELMEQNLYECLVNNKSLNPMKVKYYMYCLIRAIKHTHEKNIFHRDIKPENVLVTKNEIKLADFGSCKGIFNKHPYTQYISTRWYRAPECLMTDGYYDEKMDIWGYGCVLFEMVSRYPLFNGKNEIDQIHKINKILGTPSQSLIYKFKSHASHMKPSDWNFPKHKGIGFGRLLPNSPKQLTDLLEKLLAYDSAQRITAEQALAHPYFQDLTEASKLEKFNSTMFSFASTIRQKLKIENSPHIIKKGQKINQHPNNHMNNMKREKQKQKQKQKERQERERMQESIKQSSLPPIHHIKMDLNVNLFRETVNNKFKKTHWQYMKKKKGEK